MSNQYLSLWRNSSEIVMGRVLSAHQTHFLAVWKGLRDLFLSQDTQLSIFPAVTTGPVLQHVLLGQVLLYLQSTFTNCILPSSLSFWFSIVYKLHHGGFRSSILRRVSLLSASIVVEVIDQLLLALLHLPTRFLVQFVCLPSVGLFESQTLVSRL